MEGIIVAGRSRFAQTLACGLLVILIVGCGGSPTATPTASSAGPTEGEATLLAGLRLDLADACFPVRMELPDGAIAGLECVPQDTAIDDARVYLFNRQADMLDAYLAIVDAQGLTPRTELPGLARSEGSYWPGDGPGEPLSTGRNASWLDDAGHGHYLATAPPFVVFLVDGTDANSDALRQWAWRGNQDVPGGPTVWQEGSPVNPNGKG
jgi:hypothetical protein